MGNKILPFTTDVEYMAFQSTAFIMGSIKTNIKNYDAWLCGKYINCLYVTVFRLRDVDEWSVKEGLTVNKEIVVSPETFEQICLNAIEQNKEMLDKGIYVTGMWNEYYVPGTRFYHNYNFSHPYVIWGYDDEKEIFHVAGYLADRKYQTYEIKYTDYYSSIRNCIFEHFSLEYRHINTDFEAKINVKKLIEHLSDYLYSRKSVGETYEEGIFGIHVWEILSLHIRHSEDVLKKKELLLRDIRLYMEHKLIMYKRICYLCEHGYLKDRKICNDYLNRIYERSILVFKMSIKYNISHQSELLGRIADIAKEINREEPAYIEKMISELNEHI